MAYVPGVRSRTSPPSRRTQVDAKWHFSEPQLACSICRHGFFFHGPAAGNLAADAAIPKGRLIVYIGQPRAARRKRPRRRVPMLLEALLDEDAELCVDAFSTMGVLKEGYDREAIVATSVKTSDAAASRRARGRRARGRPPPPGLTRRTAFCRDRLPATLAFWSRPLSLPQGVRESPRLL